MDPKRQDQRALHDKAAPWWAATLIVLCLGGLATGWVDFANRPVWQAFWKGYLLDMTGPAWTYILLRGLFTAYRDTAWTRFFRSGRTVLICLGAVFSIEAIQYLGWYEATFDPWDLFAYACLVVPIYLVDRFLDQRHR